MRSEVDGPVVVAVGVADGPAVDWAAAEAAARRCRLHVVHAERLRWAVDPSGLVPVVNSWSAEATAMPLLRGAVTRVRSVASDVEVVAELAFGPTASSILARSQGAQLLVLGGRTPPVRTVSLPRLFSSTCGGVTARALCPVVVVPGLRTHPHPASPPRVVVGVDVRRPRPATLELAFRAAAQRGVPLVAVHAWSPDLPADHEGVSCPVAVSAARAEELLRRALDPWVARFADVPVATRSSIGGPASVLLRESEGAALVVVGSGAHRRVRRRLFGSVTGDVVQRARCPVVVVPAAAAPVDERAGSGRRAATAGGEPLPPRRRRSPE